MAKSCGATQPGGDRFSYPLEFTADKNRNNLRGTARARDQVPTSAYAAGHPLKALLEATPKWKRVRNQARRARPSWAGTLADPSIWL